MGSLVLGLAPQVVGTVSQAETLARLAVGVQRVCDIVEIRLDLIGTVSQAETLARLAVGVQRVCDIVEIRLDLIGPDTSNWLDQAKAIEAQGFPVILTLRLKGDGGRWTEPDAARLPLFEAGLEHLSAVDVELNSSSLEAVSAAARSRQRALIVSHHDFVGTPSPQELRRIVQRATEYGTVVKIATVTKTESDLTTLRGLLAEIHSVSLCVLGMGPLGPQTRTEFPKLGSCLTYGFVDVPAAPGQLSAAELMQQLRGS
jgi:3-dehydroquinate dehydratase I